MSPPWLVSALVVERHFQVRKTFSSVYLLWVFAETLPVAFCLFRVVECLILAVFCRCILHFCFCFPADTCARAKMAEQSRSALISSEPTESKSNSHDHEHHHHHRTLHQTLLGKGSEAPGRRVLVGVDGSEFSNFALECKC